MQSKDNTEEKPLDKINRAIQQSSHELRRLSLLYKSRGKSDEARQIDDALDRLDRRASEIDLSSEIGKN